jgi:hypothetical protein
MIKRSHFLYALIVLFALALTFFKIPVASSQGVTLVASLVEGDLPLNDPAAEAWQTAPPVEVPLSAQVVSKPFLLDSKIKSVTARALQNATQIAVMVEWADETQDDSTVAVQDFRDSAALQFPLVEGQPFFCMGQQGGNVNIWHWKADWQRDISARQEMEGEYPNMYVDYYPFTEAAEGAIAGVADYSDPNYLPAQAAGNLFASAARITPVEDLIAGGFGSLTAQPAEGQDVQGFGAWDKGQWRVIFSRALSAAQAQSASAQAEDIAFTPGKTFSVAFAVWDGSNGERNGQKSTSQWISLQLQAPAAGGAAAPAQPAQPAQAAETGFFTQQNLTALIWGAFLLAAVLIVIIAFRLPEK